jgi:hypothetical protein
MYEQASERWSPVQSVEKVILSVISMLAGVSFDLWMRRPFPMISSVLIEEPNLESGANIDCCKLYRDNREVRGKFPSIAKSSADTGQGIREACQGIDQGTTGLIKNYAALLATVPVYTLRWEECDVGRQLWPKWEMGTTSLAQRGMHNIWNFNII